MMKLPLPLLRNNKAVSYSISAVIITGVTVALVIAVSMYAYQVLEQQRGAAEYDVMKKSILAFDDAVQDVAWKLNASRMVRFKIEFGTLRLLSNAQTLNLSANIGNSSENHSLGSVSTSLIRYSIGTGYMTLGENYQSYILGNDSLIVAGGTESLGSVFIEQGVGLVNVTLSYRARAIRTSVIEVNGTMVNYVTIWLVKILTESPITHIHNFDLRARCIDIETNTFGPYDVTDADYCTIAAESEGETSYTEIGLDAGKVVFSVAVAEVKVSV